MPEDERIPITEETRRRLSDLKQPGQTDDEFVRELVRQYRQEKLKTRFRDLEGKDSDELTDLDDV